MNENLVAHLTITQNLFNYQILKFALFSFTFCVGNYTSNNESLQ